MTFALNSTRIAAASVAVPAWGLWWAEVRLADALDLAVGARVTITFADKTLVGTVASGGTVDGVSSYRIVAGAGGWGRDVTPKGYTDDAGVRVQTIVRDLASAAGETAAGVPNTRLSRHYARVAEPGTSVLNGLFPRGWYVDFDGVTQIGQRASTAYTGKGDRVRPAPDARFLELEVDEIGALVPGVTVDGSQPATDVEYVLSADKLRVLLYFGTRGNRRLDAQRRLFEALFPHLKYAGLFGYRVVRQTGDRYDLQPERVGSNMPNLLRVPVRPGMAGLRATVLPGCLVLVAFVDRDASRPAIVAFDAPDSEGWMPLSLELGGPGAVGVALLGSAVQAGPFAGAVTVASTRVKGVF